MKVVMPFVVAALTACSSQKSVKEVHVRELGLFLPEAINAEEPPAERVTILTATGKNIVFENAIIGRDGTMLLITRDGQTAKVPVDAARAVQIERNLVGPDRDKLAARVNRDDDAGPPTWTIVLGLVTLSAATLFTVLTLAEDDGL